MKGLKICLKVDFAGISGGRQSPTTPFIGVG
jgi:hypothetical protein